MAFKFGKGEGVPSHERRMAALEMQRKREEESAMGVAEGASMGLSIAGAIVGGIYGGPAGAKAGFAAGGAVGSLGKAAVASGQGKKGESMQHLKEGIGGGIGAAADIEGMEEGAEASEAVGEAGGVAAKVAALTKAPVTDKEIEEYRFGKSDPYGTGRSAAAHKIRAESMTADAGLRELYRGTK